MCIISIQSKLVHVGLCVLCAYHLSVPVCSITERVYIYRRVRCVSVAVCIDGRRKGRVYKCWLKKGVYMTQSSGRDIFRFPLLPITSSQILSYTDSGKPRITVLWLQSTCNIAKIFHHFFMITTSVSMHNPHINHLDEIHSRYNQ